MIPFGNEWVTLFNRRESTGPNGRTITSWHRSYLSGCYWASRPGRVWDGSSVVMVDETICKIPGSSHYRAPADWDAMTDPGGYFTLSPGDVLLRGVVDEDIKPTLSSSALVSKHKRSGAMVVTSVKNNVVPGLPLGHYLAKGK